MCIRVNIYKYTCFPLSFVHELMFLARRVTSVCVCVCVFCVCVRVCVCV